MTKRTMFVALATTVFAAATLMAQPPGPRRGGPGGMPPMTDNLKAYLGLSDTQVQGLQKIQEQQRAAMRTQMKDTQAKHQALRQLQDSGSTDTAALGKAMADVNTARKAHEQQMQIARDQAVSTLTPDQKTKLAALEAAMKLMPTAREAQGLGLLAPPAGGPGGPGGPGAGMMRRRGPGGPPPPPNQQ